MTDIQRVYYNLGMAYRVLAIALPDNLGTSGKINLATINPVNAFTTSTLAAHNNKIMNGKVSTVYGVIVDRIDLDVFESLPKNSVTLENQGYWQLGYNKGARMYALVGGSELKEARESNGLTQEQLADKLSVSPQQVSHWESNARPVPAKYFEILTGVFDL